MRNKKILQFKSWFLLTLSLVIFTAFTKAQHINPGPNMAAYAKYVDIPVNHYTGVPHISIPLYTINEGDLKLPISLNYHSSGFKVTEESTWVGLGWTLNAGGVITRQIRGLDDIQDFEFPLGYYNRQPNTCPEGSFSEEIEEIEFYSTYRNLDAESELNNGDEEHDIFYYNFNGHQGKFILLKNEVKLLNNDNLKIEIDINTLGNKKHIDAFVVYTKEGLAYTFSEKERSRDGNTPRCNYTTHGWYLTKIKSPSGFIINFNYSSAEKKRFECKNNLEANGTLPEWISLKQTGVEIIKGDQSKVYYDDSYFLNEIYLESITFPTGSIEFLTDCRDDYGNNYLGHKLRQITINCGKNKAYRFYYNYFQSAENGEPYLTKRLKLKRITEQVVDDENGLEYFFGYYGDEWEGNITNQPEVAQSILPRKDSYMRDHWGYYNGKNINNERNTMIPDIPGLELGYTFLGADRKVDKDFMKACMLKSITYPLGYTTSFEYEPNDYLDFETATNKSIGGGLRIKSILNKKNGTEYSKIFKYNDDNGNSSGRLHGGINYYNTVIKKSLDSKGNVISEPIIIRSSKGYVGKSSKGTVVGYSQVTEINNSLENGKTVYQFYNNSDDKFPSYKIPDELIKEFSPKIMFGCNGTRLMPSIGFGLYIPSDSYDPVGSAGLLKSKKIYKKNRDSFSIVNSEEHTYQIVSNAIIPNKIIIPIEGFVTSSAQTTSGSEIGNTGEIPEDTPDETSYETLYYQVFKYPTYHYSILSKTVTSTIDGVTQTSSYQYDKEYYQLKEKTIKTSLDETLTTRYYYPFDYSNQINSCNKLMTKNIISTPVKTETFKDQKQVNGVIIEFTEYGLPQTVYTYDPEILGVSADHNDNELVPKGDIYEAKEHFLYENQHQRLIEHRSEGGPTVSYLWEAPYHIPHTEILNASFQEVSDILNPELSLENFGKEPGDLRTDLPNAYVTNNEYAPGIGITAVKDPNGVSTYFEYNGWGQLIATLNNDKNIIEGSTYNIIGNKSMVPPCPSKIIGEKYVDPNYFTEYVYSVKQTPAATSYQWNVPTEATILSGQNTNEINIQFINNIQGTISVIASNNNGISETSELEINTCPDLIAPIEFEFSDVDGSNNPTTNRPYRQNGSNFKILTSFKPGESFQIHCDDLINKDFIKWEVPDNLNYQYGYNPSTQTMSNNVIIINVPPNIELGTYYIYVYIGENQSDCYHLKTQIEVVVADEDPNNPGE